MFSNISFLSSADVATAHVGINCCILVVVDDLVEDGANLIDAEDAAVIVQVTFLSFPLPKTGDVGGSEDGRVGLGLFYFIQKL